MRLYGIRRRVQQQMQARSARTDGDGLAAADPIRHHFFERIHGRSETQPSAAKYIGDRPDVVGADVRTAERDDLVAAQGIQLSGASRTMAVWSPPVCLRYSHAA